MIIKEVLFNASREFVKGENFCLKCDSILEFNTSKQHTPTIYSYYCPDSECPRFGLNTVIMKRK